MEAVENSLQNPDVESVQMMECDNCRFVLDEEHFVGGCPRCGCKDFGSIVENGEVVTKEE